MNLSRRDSAVKATVEKIEKHVASLREFVRYSQGYVQGASEQPSAHFPARPRVKQVVRVFGKYAADRRIQIAVDIETDLEAALVPVSLYNGVALNLYSNALKAVTAKAKVSDKKIAFRAWNENRWHFLEVSDTGIGIPTPLRARVFDPLFTTTSTNRDPLGSGMGLGLPLVRRCVEAYGGRVDVIDPPPGFVTSVRVRLPLGGGVK